MEISKGGKTKKGVPCKRREERTPNAQEETLGGTYFSIVDRLEANFASSPTDMQMHLNCSDIEAAYHMSKQLKWRYRFCRQTADIFQGIRLDKTVS